MHKRLAGMLLDRSSTAAASAGISNDKGIYLTLAQQERCASLYGLEVERINAVLTGAWILAGATKDRAERSFLPEASKIPDEELETLVGWIKNDPKVRDEFPFLDAVAAAAAENWAEVIKRAGQETALSKRSRPWRQPGGTPAGDVTQTSGREHGSREGSQLETGDAQLNNERQLRREARAAERRAQRRSERKVLAGPPTT